MEPEFAPEYSAKSRWQRFAIVASLVPGSYAALEWWLVPMLRRFADNAPCQTVLGIPGHLMLFYGFFVGFPFSLALLVGTITIPSSLRAIRARRYPPPGKKVFHRTKVKTGWRAIAIASVQIVLVICLAGVGVWGFGPANEIVRQGDKTHPHGWNCAVNPAFERTSVGKATDAPQLRR